MAIKKIPPEENNKLNLSFDNGDFEALSQVLKKFNFVSEEALLRFALVILLRTDDNVIYIEEGGKKIGLTPSKEYLKSPEIS